MEAKPFLSLNFPTNGSNKPKLNDLVYESKMSEEKREELNLFFTKKREEEIKEYEKEHPLIMNKILEIYSSKEILSHPFPSSLSNQERKVTF